MFSALRFRHRERQDSRIISPFIPNASFLYPRKHQKTLRFSDDFREQRKGELGINWVSKYFHWTQLKAASNQNNNTQESKFNCLFIYHWCNIVTLTKANKALNMTALILWHCVFNPFNPFQSSVAFHIETIYLICYSSNDWFLYKMQQWAEMG